MQGLTRFALLLLPFVCVPSSLTAAPTPLSLKWNQLAGALDGRHVVVELKDHSRIQAVVTSVAASGLTLQVTSNSHPTYRKGTAEISRESVAGLRLVHMRIRGRILGGIFGVLGGIIAGGVLDLAAQDCDSLFGPCRPANRGLQVTAAAVGIAIPVSAYAWGRHADRQEIEIILLPD